MSTKANIEVYKRTGLFIIGGAILLLSAYMMGWMATSEEYGFLPLVLVLGVSGAFLILKRPAVGFALVFFFVPLGSFSRLIGGERTITLALAVLLLGIYGSRVLILHERIKFDRISQFACAFVAWGIITSLWAYSPAVSFSKVLRLSQMIALYVLILNYCRNRRQLNIIALSFAIGAAFAATLAILQGKTQGGGRLILDEEFNPNAFSGILGIGMIIVLFYFYETKHKLRKVLLILSAIPIGYSIIQTQSRGVWIGLPASLLISIILVTRNIKLIRNAIIIVTILIGVFISAYYAGIIDETIVKRYETITSGDFDTMSANRTEIWKVGLEMLSDKPILGVGFGNYKAVYLNYADIAGISIHTEEGVLPRGHSAHNTFLEVLAETGLIGFVIFISIFIYLFKNIWRITDPMTRLMCMWLFGFIISLGLKGSYHYIPWFWFVLILINLEARLGKKIDERVFSR